MITFFLHYEVSQLQCDHEEADTRLLLHSKHSAKTHDTIMVKKPDTDVFLLCIAMRRTIDKNVLVKTETSNRFRIIDISTILDALGHEICTCLPGFHAFSGTQYVSTYFVYVYSLDRLSEANNKNNILLYH